jgi:hypothetical protein
MKYIEVEPIFLKIKGGWINPVAILSVETHRDNEAMLSVRVVGMERPISLREADSAMLTDYLESRKWPVAKEEQGFVHDEVSK